jgi:integrase
MSEHLQKKGIRVTGHISEVRGIYHIKLSWIDNTGKRCRKSISTELMVKGNTKRAEDLLRKACKEQEEIVNLVRGKPRLEDWLFADFMEEWLEAIRPEVKLTTFGGYQMNVQKIIAPYFRKKGIMLQQLTADDINAFYAYELKRVKGMTVHKFHANISKALKYAVEMDYIPHTIMEKVKRPKADRFTGKFLKQSEMVNLFEAVKGHKLELGVIFGAFYGLRRSEIIGLRWESINFEANTITVEHTVTVANVDGKRVVVADDTTKTKSSFRTLPLVPAIRAKLFEVKEEQEYNRKLCGKSYNTKESAYIYTDALGNRIKPDYLSSEFPKYMQHNGFRRIRYHDLRHSCASLLLANGVSLKQIQDWLGHSHFAITANIYAHLDFSAKQATADAMVWLGETSLSGLLEIEADESPQLHELSCLPTNMIMG